MHQGDMMESASKLVSKDRFSRIDSISKLLAVLLAESKNYGYIDRLGYSQSRDLVVFYIREALRDFHSINNRGWKNERAKEKANEIDMDLINKGIEDIARTAGMRELRERVSLITAKALAIAAPLIKSRKEEEEKTKEEEEKSNLEASDFNIGGS